MHNAWGNPTVKNCTFTANAAAALESEGGAMYNYQSTPTLTDCSFSKNACADEGGAMRNHYSSLTLTNCTFTGNSARSGGGMYNRYSSPTLTNCTFSDNSAQDSGGAVYDSNSSPTLTDCTFTDNSAVHYGGGMRNRDSSSPTLTNCSFNRNSVSGSGSHGHGMSNGQGCAPELINCIFSRNRGTFAGYGSGMYNGWGSSPTLTNCIFIGNRGAYGGAMHNYTSSPMVTNCTFSGNEAASDGGGMYNVISSPTVTNCTFSGNSASSGGGGMYNYANSSPTLTNCTFSSNSAPNGNALACGSYLQQNPSDLQVTNCIVWDGGSEVYNADGSTITITYSDVQGGWLGTGNVVDDPLFVDADGPDDVFGTADDNLRLSAGSPCIDAGDNDAVPPDACDLDGDGDTTEPIPWDCDTHPRFLDVWTVLDTGNGTAPIVDMGAYEYANMKIKKCKAAAGSRPGRDSFTCSAKMYATPPQVVDANQITVNIWGSDDYLVYSETINVKPIKLKKRSYIYKHRLRKKRNRGFITYFAVDLKKHTFSLKAKKIDLTGLSCPLFVGIEVGDYVGLGKAAERIVNGKKKLIPIRFMRGYADTLRAGKRRVKPRSLKVRGGIAVADWPNPANLKTRDVTITWGTQQFTIPAGSFYTKKKWNNKYKCKQAPVLGGGIATATIDFKKCSFKLLIKKTNIDSQSGLVDFSMAVDTFDQTVGLNL